MLFVTSTPDKNGTFLFYKDKLSEAHDTLLKVML